MLHSVSLMEGCGAGRTLAAPPAVLLCVLDDRCLQVSRLHLVCV